MVLLLIRKTYLVNYLGPLGINGIRETSSKKYIKVEKPSFIKKIERIYMSKT